LLDEWGNAEQAALKRMPECMFDFRLRDDGEIEVADIGEATYDFILGTCYPELEKALGAAESDENGSDFSSEGKPRSGMQSNERGRAYETASRPRKKRRRSSDAIFRSRPALRACW
jgi:hypothetical protein